MPLPLTVYCFSRIQIGFTFLVPAHPGSPGKGPLNGCVCSAYYSKTLLSVQSVVVEVAEQNELGLHYPLMTTVSSNTKALMWFTPNVSL